MKFRLLLAALIGTIAILLGFNGCNSNGGDVGKSNDGLKFGSGEAEPPSVPGKYGGKEIDSSISDPKTFNIITANETSSTEPLGALMFAGLINRNEYTLKFEPVLAGDHKMSSDGLTHTYTLLEGLKWSDGRPLTADDVIFTLDVIFDPKTEGSNRDVMLIDVDQPDGSVKREPFKYRKIDARTVEFVLPTKWAPWESTFSFPIIPKHKLEEPYKAGQFNSTWGVNVKPEEIVCNGAFILQEYVPRQRMVFKRNPYYYRKSKDGKQQLPYLDEFVTLSVPDLNTTTLKFRNGDTDALISMKHEDFPSLKKEEAKGNYTVINRGPGWGFNYISFNMNPTADLDKNLLKLFQDVRFRRAISHAINRQRMADDIFLGMAKPGYGPVSPANKLFYNPDVPKFEYDLSKAKSLLMEIGLKDTNGDNILKYNGQPVKFNILTNAENEQRKAMATIISEDLRKIGLSAQFTPVAFNDLVRRLDTKPYKWEACVLGFTGSPEVHSGSNIWKSTGRLHQWYPRQRKPATEWEAEIDKLYTQGAHEMDPAKRKEIYGRWQAICGEQQPMVATVVVEAVSALRNKFGNIKPTSLYYPFKWNADEIFDRSASRATP